MHESYLKPSALIIVDVQNDFISGSLAVAGGEQVAHDIVAHIRGGFGGWEHDFVVTTQDWHIDPGDHFSDEPNYATTWPAHCVAGTHGAALHDALGELSSPDWWHFYKGRHSAAYSGFEGHLGEQGRGPDLEKFLEKRGVDMVDICGLATDYCVKATALDAVKAGFATTLLTGLCAAVGDGQAAIDEMKAAGVTIL